MPVESAESPAPTLPVSTEPVGAGRRVALLTLGCARNEVDSDELATQLSADGWQVSEDGTAADVVLVNTCGFVAKAKQDSIDTLLAAAQTGAKVVAAGCLAERYGKELADSLPEAAAVLGFDHYPDISTRLVDVLEGRPVESHTPRDRRTLLPLTPVRRPSQANAVVVPGHALPSHLRSVPRKRLGRGPVAPLKLASGCDRRCAFCAIPSFRGAFVSRRPEEILDEAHWLAEDGVRELLLVSENSTSFGKDLGDPDLLAKLLPQLAAVPGIVRVRVSYLQPAETRPDLIEAIAGTPGVAPYFDLSFQHASEPVLRRMRRFGSAERFGDLLARVRALAPLAGVRSNVIVGFPGETRADVAILVRFLAEARMDAVGVFDYSDEDGTEAATLPEKVSAATVRRRYQRLSELAEQLCAQRAQERVGEIVDVLVDTVGAVAGCSGAEPGGSQPRPEAGIVGAVAGCSGAEPGGSQPRPEAGIVGALVEGRAAHQAPDVDGSTTLVSAAVGAAVDLAALRPGDLVRAKVVSADGADLVAEPIEMISAAVG